MKILIVGGTGTIGKAVVAELKQRHDVIVAGRNSGDVLVDLTDVDSIKKMYQDVGMLDAVVAATGKVVFKPLDEMTEEDYLSGLQNKLMGMVSLVTHGLDNVNPNGSFTLLSGILNRDPIKLGSSAAMINGAIDGFVKGAAIEMPRGIRINVVSPTVVAEAMDKYAVYFRGFTPVAAAKVALAFSKSVEGRQTGQIYCVG